MSRVEKHLCMQAAGTAPRQLQPGKENTHAASNALTKQGVCRSVLGQTGRSSRGLRGPDNHQLRSHAAAESDKTVCISNTDQGACMQGQIRRTSITVNQSVHAQGQCGPEAVKF